MEINNINNDQYLDLFSTETKPKESTPQFTAQEQEVEVDILGTPVKTQEEVKVEEEVKTPEEEKEVDILGESTKPGRKPKYAFEDAVGYFEDRINSGKFVKIEEEKEDGTIVSFIPKTPEEFDEVIDIQVDHKLGLKMKELDKNWYDNKPAAWKAVAKYAEMVENPADIIPFLQGVQNIESVVDLDENDPVQAERIVRLRLEQRGESNELINEQVEMLRSTEKLVSTAQKYKPIILNEEKQYLNELNRTAELEQKQYAIIVNDIRDKAIDAIESPIFGKQKLTNEEKSLVYDMIAVPDAQSQGYKIYNEIDQLFEKRDFETLKQISLLLKKKDAYIGYLTTDVKNETASQLAKKLRAVNDNRSSSQREETDDRPSVQRQSQYTKSRFGR